MAKKITLAVLGAGLVIAALMAYLHLLAHQLGGSVPQVTIVVYALAYIAFITGFMVKG